jgi:hypothetical protein
MTGTRALGASAVYVTGIVGAGAFALAYDDATYALTSRSAVAVAVWWTIAVGVALGVWPLGRLTRAAVVPGALLAAFAAWDLASTAWSASAEDAFVEFDRTALYLGIYLLVVLAADPHGLMGWVDGLAVAIAAIGVVALVSRLFPGSFPHRGLTTALPNAAGRLSFPLDYWNGLGIFVALGVPLLLAAALDAGPRRRALVAGVLPALGAVVYLTSSRGAVVALAGGIAVFMLAASRRGAALRATLACAAGSAVSIGVVASGLGGYAAAVLVAFAGLGTAAVLEYGPRLPAVPRRVGVAAAIVVSLTAVAVAVYALRDFAQLPPASAATPGGHLLAGGGSGRWQFWQAALAEFRSEPLHGGGAGSYETWWNRHGSFSYVVRDAHSLYLETLGELGLVGFVLLAGALAAALTAGVRRLRRSDGEERTLLAALLGAATAYLIGAGIDWMWELTAVTLVAMCILGLLAGSAATDRSEHPRRLARAAVAAVALGVAVAEAVALLAAVEVNESQAAVRAGRLGRAHAHAVAATKLEPWAATPYLQLALVDESSGDFAAALRSAKASLARDRENWQPWLVASRIEMRLGDKAAAARDRAHAGSLDPRSPLFARRR